MNSEILIDDIYEFRNRYREDGQNIETEKKIKDHGIMKASIDEGKKSGLKFEFNVEVPDVKIYNQLSSHQCNIYAFLRVVKDILRKNTTLDVDKLDLSSNYINFYDKLEKANVLLNDLLSADDLSLEKINGKVNRYIGSFGTFKFCKEIVNKYGLVPTEFMGELNSSFDDTLAIELLKDKIKSDAASLIDIESTEERLKKKRELLYEVYRFLSKIYGNPPTNFEFRGNLITPLQFKDHYLKDSLDDYVTVTSFTKDTLFKSYAFIPNIYLNDNENIIELPDTQIKEAIVRQLKDGVSVWFSCEESTTLDYDENILDDKLYDFAGLLNIQNTYKEQKLLLDMINYDHAMCITGALTRGREVLQFKVDNSFGKHGRYKGQLIMTETFFDNCVIAVIINKKYIN